MLRLAKRTSRAKPSTILAVAEKAKALRAQGRDVISFAIGVPNFLPGHHVYDAAAAALRTDSGQYGSNTACIIISTIMHLLHSVQ